MENENAVNSHNDCSSKYSTIMNMIYNVENKVEKMMKTREATIKYNDCLYLRDITKNTHHNIKPSYR